MRNIYKMILELNYINLYDSLISNTCIMLSDTSYKLKLKIEC